MMVTILWRLAGEPAPSAAPAFTDVEPGKWFSDAIAWAAENKVVLGIGSNKFAPTDPVSREQMALMVYRWAEDKGFDISSGRLTFDEGASARASDAVLWAMNRNLLVYRSEEPSDVWNPLPALHHSYSIDLAGSATRAEVAVCLSRFCMEFADIDDTRITAVVTVDEDCLPEISTPDTALSGTRSVTTFRGQGTAARWELWWKLKSTQEKFGVAKIDLDLLTEPVYDAKGRLVEWYPLEGSCHCSIIYSAWGDPLIVEVDHDNTRDVLSFYYENVNGHSVLVACGRDWWKPLRF